VIVLVVIAEEYSGHDDTVVGTAAQVVELLAVPKVVEQV
jgi:hypothetical protein